MEKMKKLLICLLVVICGLSLVGCGNKEEKKNDKQNNESTIGYVEKETVNSLLSKFNNVIENHSRLGTVPENSGSVNNGNYWYPIEDGIYLVVKPADEQKSPEEDIVGSMRIYYEDSVKDEAQIPVYTKLLVIANNEEISEKDAEKLVNESKDLAKNNLTSNNGKGISVGYAEASDHYEYQVIRNYK